MLVCAVWCGIRDRPGSTKECEYATVSSDAGYSILASLTTKRYWAFEEQTEGHAAQQNVNDNLSLYDPVTGPTSSVYS